MAATTIKIGIPYYQIAYKFYALSRRTFLIILIINEVIIDLRFSFYVSHVSYFIRASLYCVGKIPNICQALLVGRNVHK